MERMRWLSNTEWSGSLDQSGNVLRLGRKRTGGGEGGGRDFDFIFSGNTFVFKFLF